MKTIDDLLKYEIQNINTIDENLYAGLEGTYTNVTLINKDIALKELDLDKFLNKTEILVIDGNLSVEGGIINAEGDYGVALIVTGNVNANFIIAGGSEIILRGKTVIKSIIYGHYNHGSLSIPNVEVPIVMNDDHCLAVYGKITKECDFYEEEQPIAKKYHETYDFIEYEEDDGEDCYYLESFEFIQHILDDKNRAEFCEKVLENTEVN